MVLKLTVFIKKIKIKNKHKSQKAYKKISINQYKMLLLCTAYILPLIHTYIF